MDQQARDHKLIRYKEAMHYDLEMITFITKTACYLYKQM